MIMTHPFLNRYVNRLYIYDQKFFELEEALKHFDYKDKVFRLQVSPRSREAEVCKKLEGEYKAVLNPKEFTHVLSILFDHKKIYGGLVPRSLYFERAATLDEASEAISRAYYKIQESIERFKIQVNSDWLCMDVGASPGGYESPLMNLTQQMEPISG